MYLSLDAACAQLKEPDERLLVGFDGRRTGKLFLDAVVAAFGCPRLYATFRVRADATPVPFLVLVEVQRLSPRVVAEALRTRVLLMAEEKQRIVDRAVEDAQEAELAERRKTRRTGCVADPFHSFVMRC